MQIGLLFAAVGHCKKVYDTVNNMRKVPEEAYFLWQLLDAMQPALEILSVRNSQEAHWRVVNKSVELVYETLCQCDVLLVRSDPDGRPSDAPSWEAWWSAVPGQAKECASRVSLIPKFTQRLHQCIAAMQLALVASTNIAATSSLCGAATGGAQHRRFAVEPIARSRSIMHLFEAGRLDGAAGRQYQLGQGTLYKRAEQRGPWKALGSVGVVLRRCTLAGGVEAYEWVFVQPAASADAADSGAAAGDAGVPTSGPEVGRVRSGAPLGKIASRIAFTPGQTQWHLTVLPPSPQHNSGPTAAAARFVFAPNASAATNEQPQPVAPPLSQALFALEYSSCLAPSQYCFFPSADETYHHVTVDVAQLIFVYCAALQQRAGPAPTQVDAVVPVVVDETSTEGEHKQFESFVAAYTTTSAV